MYIPKMDRYPTPPENKTDITNMNGPFILVKGINDLKAISQPNSISLYHLDAENSPYRKTQNLAGV